MKKNLGFGSFEFYFVVAVIGLVLIAAIKRYNQLTTETQRLSFEVLSQNFSAAVYSHRAAWILSQHEGGFKSSLLIEGRRVGFSSEGWPIGVDLDEVNSTQATAISCRSLWVGFLQNAPLISLEQSSHKEKDSYKVGLTDNGKCRYEWSAPSGPNFQFEYSPAVGSVQLRE